MKKKKKKHGMEKVLEIIALLQKIKVKIEFNGSAENIFLYIYESNKFKRKKNVDRFQIN
jgi:hypothetical protein